MSASWELGAGSWELGRRVAGAVACLRPSVRLSFVDVDVGRWSLVDKHRFVIVFVIAAAVMIYRVL